MADATAWWGFWLGAALVLYLGLAWALVRLGDSAEAGDVSRAASNQEIQKRRFIPMSRTTITVLAVAGVLVVAGVIVAIASSGGGGGGDMTTMPNGQVMSQDQMKQMGGGTMTMQNGQAMPQGQMNQGGASTMPNGGNMSNKQMQQMGK